MRRIIIGDVHGCLEEWRELLKVLSFRKGEDFLLQVGDLLDRGPDPVGCVRYARELGAIVLMGNHEEKHLRWRRHEDRRAAVLREGRTPKKNPMKAFSETKAAQNAALSDDDIAWIASLPLSYDLGGGLHAVHAGCEPRYSIADQSRDVLTRLRYVGTEEGHKRFDRMVGYAAGSLDQPENTIYWSERWQGPESIVYGHAVHSLTEPKIDAFPGGRCYGIDTGCCFGGRLTAMVLEDGREPEFVQVQAREAYSELYQKRPDGSCGEPGPA
jgi:diadenosine tetraphosphatase ApaH/serine/threonine PP2A family protein phosphatase